MTTSIEDAMANLADERTKLIEQLKAVREDLRSKRAAFPGLKQSWRDKTEARDNAHRAVIGRDQLIAINLGERPSVFDLLPTDPECVRWKRRHDALIADRDQHVAERDSLPDPEGDRQAASDLNAAIIQLEWAERNLLRAIRTGSGNAEGGISGVS